MKEPIANLIRIIIPRSWRNTLRRPRVTAARVRSKIEFAFGKSSILSILPEWSIHCHPICVTEFGVFQKDPAQMAEMLEFVHHCTPGMRLLDVGAHWGIFTLAAHHYGGRAARVVCVEPSSDAAWVLKQNLTLNGVAEVVTVVEIAAGAEAGVLQMLTTGAGGADYFVVPAEHRLDTITVPQVDLTGLCQSLGFAPTHVKMDIEGFEEEGLLGAREMLHRDHPILFLELHGDLIRRRGRDPMAVLCLLKETGYPIWKQAGRLVSQHHLKRQNFNARLICLADSPGS